MVTGRACGLGLVLAMTATLAGARLLHDRHRAHPAHPARPTCRWQYIAEVEVAPTFGWVPPTVSWASPVRTRAEVLVIDSFLVLR